MGREGWIFNFLKITEILSFFCGVLHGPCVYSELVVDVSTPVLNNGWNKTNQAVVSDLPSMEVEDQEDAPKMNADGLTFQLKQQPENFAIQALEGNLRGEYVVPKHITEFEFWDCCITSHYFGPMMTDF